MRLGSEADVDTPTYTILAFKGYRPRPAAQDSHIIHFANTCSLHKCRESQRNRVSQNPRYYMRK